MRNVRPAPLILTSISNDSETCLQVTGLLSGAQCSAQLMKTAGSQIFSAGLTLAEDTLTSGLKSAKEGFKSAKEFVDQSIDKARDALTQSIHHALKTAKAAKGGLIGYHDLPIPWRINPYITKGYRFCEHQVDCVHSIFSLSNEFVNIWSHALGFVCVLFIAVYVFPNSNLKTTTLDNFFIGLFLMAAAKCMLFSCTYHTMNSIADQQLNRMFTCVDYTGISLLIATSIMTTEHFAFYCNPVSWWFYISITGALGLAGVAIPWHPFFRGNEKAWLRVAFYASLMYSGIIPPMIHLTFLHGWTWTLSFYAPLGKSLIIYMGGSAIYAAKVPEKWFPGIFDFAGGSHNIWHCAVLVGVMLHYNAVTEMFNKSLEVASAECRPGLFG